MVALHYNGKFLKIVCLLFTVVVLVQIRLLSTIVVVFSSKTRKIPRALFVAAFSLKCDVRPIFTGNITRIYFHLSP